MGGESAASDGTSAEHAARSPYSAEALMETAEKKFQQGKYREAAKLFMALASVEPPMSPPMLAAARKRLADMEGMAQKHLDAERDAYRRCEYLRGVEELTIILREFPFTKAKDEAVKRLSPGQPSEHQEAYEKFWQAKRMESQGNLSEALRMYRAIAEDPRYQGIVPGFNAKRKVRYLSREMTSER